MSAGAVCTACGGSRNGVWECFGASIMLEEDADCRAPAVQLSLLCCVSWPRGS